MSTSDLVSLVQEEPGAHFNEIVELLDVTPDKLQRLTKELDHGESIQVSEFYGKTHFYPSGYDEWEKEAIALIRRETTREILYFLLEHESASPSEITDHVGIARSTLEWHIDRLGEAGIVTKNRDGWSVEIQPTKPEEVAGLLAEVRPTLSEQWIDRTTRLLDHMFEETH